MKKVYIDPGDFYTKVNVVEVSKDGFKYYGRSFFPSIVEEARTPAEKIIYYGHDSNLYRVGYDCACLEQNLTAGTDQEMFHNDLRERVILNKIIWDYADPGEELELNIVVDNPISAAIFTDIKKRMSGSLRVRGVRGYDQLEIERIAKITINVLATSDGICDFVSRMKHDFNLALVIDMGYRRTKAYIVNPEMGVELYQTQEVGVAVYYEVLLKLIREKQIANVTPIWMIKQIESGFRKIEVNYQNDCFDISAILKNVRWDLNKDFRRIVSDLLRGYYTNTTKWLDMLIVIGGGAPLNGDILCDSLHDDGLIFSGIYVEKLPLYTLVMGAMRDHIGDQISNGMKTAVL